ncbi:hypothetical protein [Dongia sp. agr-C8]
MTDRSAIEAARRRLAEATEKFDRQTRRYALMTVSSDAGSKVGSSERGEAAKALLAELEAELEAAKAALQKLEKDPAQ